MSLYEHNGAKTFLFENAMIKPKFQFRLSTVLLLVVIVGLIISQFIMQRRLSRFERETMSQRALSTDEVASQFVKLTSNTVITTKVTDVRYSGKLDSYLVSFSWIDPTTKKNWEAEVELKPNGYGTYSGSILHKQFYKAVGVSAVKVKTPSGFTK